MPAYNASQFIKDAIESILVQTFRDFEFIIINDGSTDNTESIIRSYNDERIKYIKNEKNLGLIASLNKGLNIAAGTYISRMDADDIALPERLKLQLDYFNKFPDTIAVGSDYFLLQNKKLSRVKNVNDSDYLKGILLFSPCFCHPSVMFKKEISGKVAEYKREYLHAEDYKMWTDLSLTGKFGNVNVPLLKYRAHNSQISYNNRLAQQKISERIREEYYEQLGFSLSNGELRALHIVGNNVFITSEEILRDIDKALLSLKKQNESLKKFNTLSFERLLLKFWSDSCGYTNLGMRAFRIFLSSRLSASASFSLRFKVLAKSIIRKYRNPLKQFL